MTIGKKINGVRAATTLNDLPKGVRYLGTLTEVYSRDADQTDFHFDLEPTDALVFVQLPALAESYGAIYSFKKIIPGGFSCTVYANPGDPIDDDISGAANVTLSSNGECIILVNAGGRWRSIAHMTSNA